MSYRSVLNVSNGGQSNPKLTLKINSLRIKPKAQNFASWMLNEYAFNSEETKEMIFWSQYHFKLGQQNHPNTFYTLTLVLAVTGRAEHWLLFHFWHLNLSSSSPEGEDLFNDTQIRVTGSMELKRCMKMYRNLNGRRGAKFPAMALSYFTVTIAHLYAFLEILKLEASPVEGQSLLQKDKKRIKRKGKRIKKLNVKRKL